MKKYNAILGQVITIDPSYKGLIKRLDSNKWEIVAGFDDELKAKLLVSTFLDFDFEYTTILSFKLLGNGKETLLIAVDKLTRDFVKYINKENEAINN